MLQVLLAYLVFNQQCVWHVGEDRYTGLGMEIERSGQPDIRYLSTPLAQLTLAIRMAKVYCRILGYKIILQLLLAWLGSN
jgi:hypothetical protein